MSERTQPEDSQDPEPIRHSEAQRLTDDEARQVPGREEDQPERSPGEPETKPD
jgi:hypothetical protein